MDCRVFVRILIQAIVLLCITTDSHLAAARPVENGLFDQISRLFHPGQQHGQSIRDGRGSLSPRKSRVTLGYSESSLDALSIPRSQPILYPHPVPSQPLAKANVLRFEFRNREEATSLMEATTHVDLDVWAISQNWLDVRVDQAKMKTLLHILPSHLRTTYKVLMNASELSEAVGRPHHQSAHTLKSAGMQGFELTIGRNPFQMPTDEFFQDYRPLSVMTPWMQLLQSLYPTHLQLLNIGYSFENREILAFRIGAKSIGHEPHATSRKTILITGGTHAREWIGVSTANFIAHALISNYGNDNDITTLLESIDVVVIPTINPDGYDYTWKTDRLWRKNRQTTPLPFCRGIDLDRSFGFMWGDFASRANSNNPCSENYAGEEAFEGVEAQRIADWVQEEMDEKNTTFVGYMDLHSYSQQILVPFAFSCYDDPPNFEDLEETGEGLAKAIRRIHLRNYAVDRACESNVIGVAMDATLREGPQLDLESGGGSPLDWMYRFGIKNAFQIKLRDTGSYGFLLPKEHIVPTGEEILNAFMYLGNTVKSSISGQNRSDKT